MTRRTGSTRWLPALAACLLAAPDAWSAQWRSSADFGVTMLGEQNPGLVPDEAEEAASSEAAAGFRLQRRDERLDITLAPRISARRYANQSGLDREEYMVNLDTQWTGERAGWGSGARIARESTSITELGTTGFTGSNQQRRERFVSVDAWYRIEERLMLQGGLSVQDMDYPDTGAFGLRDYRRDIAQLGFNRTLSERIGASLSVSAAALRLDGAAPESRDQSARLAVQASLSTAVELTASAGLNRVERAGEARNGRVLALGLRGASDRASIALDASRGLEPVGLGLITESDQLRVDAGYRLRERLRIAAAFSARRSRYLLQSADATLASSRYARAELSLGWQFAPAWRASGLVGHTWNRRADVTATAAGFDARLTLGWNATLHER